MKAGKKDEGRKEVKEAIGEREEERRKKGKRKQTMKEVGGERK